MGKSITGLQCVRQEIESRYESQRTPLLNIVQLRKAQAEIEEAKMKASALEREKLEMQRIVLVNKQRYLEAELQQQRCIADTLWNQRRKHGL